MNNEKPSSMAVGEWLIKKLSHRDMISEKTIIEVITHQYDAAYDAFKTNESVEISNFGKFVFNRKKAERQLKSLHKIKEHCLSRIEKNGPKVATWRSKLALTEKNIEILKERL